MKRGIPKKTQKQPIRKTTRITYSASQSGFLDSSPILLGSELCFVQIDKKNKVYRVLALNAPSLCFALGNGKDVEECKRNAREKLVNCGARVLEEVRVRK